MIPRVVCLFFLSGILLGHSIQCYAAPKEYDQKQNDESNIKVYSEDLMFFIPLAKEMSTFVKKQLNFMFEDLKDTTEEPSVAYYEEVNAEKSELPSYVDITWYKNNFNSDKYMETESDNFRKIPDDKDVEIIMLESEESKDQEGLSENLNVNENSEMSAESKSVRKEKRSLWRNKKDYMNSLKKKNKKSAELENLGIENLEQSDDSPVREDATRASRPGMLLKKQLSKKEEKVTSSLLDERNGLTHSFHELVLLGDGIENCGPGRYRDDTGVCQDDENFY